jgi:hypothetical protein
MPNGLDGFGLLGLTAATSKIASSDTVAGGATGSCADAIVAASRVAKAKAVVERMLFMSL